jgi:hypothetical protein
VNLPSEYINRNVRVTPFNDFEPVAQDFQRYPQVADSYCYATDYPHVEGGKESKQKMYDQLPPLGEEIAEKIFVTNAELLMPNWPGTHAKRGRAIESIARPLFIVIPRRSAGYWEVATGNGKSASRRRSGSGR